MKIAELKKNIKGKSDADLRAQVHELREALRQNRFSSHGSRGRDVKKARESRKAVARALTELRRRALS